VWLGRRSFRSTGAPEPEVEQALRTVGAAAIVRLDGPRFDEAPDATRAAFVQWTSGTTGAESHPPYPCRHPSYSTALGEL
jgi:hypothetical protein